MIFILSLIAAAIFIVALVHISMLMWVLPNRKGQDRDREPYQRDAIQTEEKTMSADFAALIDAITKEGRASRAEEKREDDDKKKREWITIGLIALTLGLLGWQVSEMIRVYDPIQTQAEAAIGTQRAWIGPTEANIASGLVVGRPIKVAITYANTGREPGTAFTANGIFKVFNITEWNDGSATKYFNEYIDKCMSSTSTGGSVSFPTSGASQYRLYQDSSAEAIPEAARIVASQRLIEGADVIALTECFVYHSISKIHHTSFCYYYNAKVSDVAHLNICNGGSDSD